MAGGWVVAEYQYKKAHANEKADKPQGQAYPLMSLKSISEAFVGHNNIAYYKVDCVPEKISPASFNS